MVRPQTAVLPFLLASTASASSYALVDSYDHTNFFSSFDFFNGPDPTNGFVKYVDAPTANSSALAGYLDNKVYLGVDHKTASAPAGRQSTRLTSKKTYTRGLFVADIAHMPVGCGVWPAFWTFGPGWPSSGEIDVLEGVNSATTNAVTLHTSAGCSVDTAGSMASSRLASNNANCNAGSGTLGCSQQTAGTTAYGPGFNAAGGGVYAMEWTSQAISVWFLPRGSSAAAAAASNGNLSSAAAPDPSTFGTPVARFSGCNIDAHFANHNIVFNTALCGDWAGKVWDQDPTCSSIANTCQDFVASNSTAFRQAYWLINSVKVYQQQQPSKTRRGMIPRSFLA